MIWLSRRVRWRWRGFFTLDLPEVVSAVANFFANGEYIRLYGWMSTEVPEATETAEDSRRSLS
jgi:hypothetical protein